MRAIDASGAQPWQQAGREHQEVHAEARIAAECGVVDPERVDALIGMQVAGGIDPSLLDEPAKGAAPRRPAARAIRCKCPGTTLRSPASTAGFPESSKARACALKRSNQASL